MQQHNQDIENPHPQETQLQAPPQMPMPPQGPMMVPPMMAGQAMPGPQDPMGAQPIAQPMPRGWRERMMRRFGMDMYARVRKGERTIPDWMMGKPLAFFFVSMFACWVVFGNAMPALYAGFSILSVLLFFVGTRYLSVKWKQDKTRLFTKHLFVGALLVRLIWVLFGYFYYNEAVYGRVDGFGDDNGWYLDFAQGIAKWIRGDGKRSFGEVMKWYGSAIDDTGYPFWLALLYILSFDSSDVFVPLIAKAVLGAYSCICIYRVTARHFGEGAARIAGLFMCLNPYVIFWCSSMLKEAEMMFLCCLCVDKTDQALSSEKGLTFMGLLPGMLAASALFFFRAPLGIVAVLAIFAHVVFVSKRVMSIGKKVIIGILVGVIVIAGMGDRLRTQANMLTKQVQSGQSQALIAERADKKGGNQLAKYATAAVFAPLIFTIPFPTFNMVNEEQIMQMELSGANYIKNILSFFVILVMLLLLISGEWRRHVFILAYTLGYHVILVMSSFAQSGRHHAPVIPMILLFAAYGIQVAKGNKELQRGFTIALVLEVVICLAWNWFKLKGRGMI